MGVLLHGLALLDEGVLGAGEAALHHVAHDRSAELGAEARRLAEHLAGGKHFDSGVEMMLRFVGGLQSLVNMESEVFWLDLRVFKQCSDQVIFESFVELLIGWTAEALLSQVM